MSEIQLPKEQFSHGPININLQDYAQKREEKKNLARLSPEEFAQLSDEEVERARRAQENLVAYRKADREVRTMEQQDQWNEKVQQFVEEHQVSAEEAEQILRRRAGLDKPSDFATMMQMMQPKQSPIEQAFANALAANAEKMFARMFGGEDNSQKPQPSPEQARGQLTEAIQNAKAAGAQSLYLPDGTVLNLGQQSPNALSQAVENYYSQMIEQAAQRVPDVLAGKGSNNANPATTLPPGTPPELMRLYFEDKWKTEERQAEDARYSGREKVLTELLAMIATGLSPQGYPKIKKLLSEGLPAVGRAPVEGEAEAPQAPPARMLKTTCWKCMRRFPYEEGQEPVCPYCGQPQKVQCPKCETVFTPTSADHIVCPSCAAELEVQEKQAPEQREVKRQKIGQEEQEQPPPEESPLVQVGMNE